MILYTMHLGMAAATSLFSLPQIEGPLLFKAINSRYTELYCDVKFGNILLEERRAVSLDFDVTEGLLEV